MGINGLINQYRRRDWSLTTAFSEDLLDGKEPNKMGVTPRLGSWDTSDTVVSFVVRYSATILNKSPHGFSQRLSHQSQAHPHEIPMAYGLASILSNREKIPVAQGSCRSRYCTLYSPRGKAWERHGKGTWGFILLILHQVTGLLVEC